MSDSLQCSPGSVPHIPNWHPAETIEEYFANCREGLEKLSEKRFAALMGMNRMQLWRASMMSKIPEELFERLLRCGNRRPSTKQLAAIGKWFADGKPPALEAERCPHCGGVTRMRQPWSTSQHETVLAWLREREEVRT